MIQLTLTDTTVITLPETLMAPNLISKADYSIERAPYSNRAVIAGDGLPKAQPLKIKGMAYFSTSAEANTWVKDLRTNIDSIASVDIDGNTFDVWAADLVVVPNRFPRVLNVTMNLYPKVAQ